MCDDRGTRGAIGAIDATSSLAKLAAPWQHSAGKLQKIIKTLVSSAIGLTRPSTA